MGIRYIPKDIVIEAVSMGNLISIRDASLIPAWYTAAIADGTLQFRDDTWYGLAIDGTAMKLRLNSMVIFFPDGKIRCVPEAVFNRLFTLEPPPAPAPIP